MNYKNYETGRCCFITETEFGEERGRAADDFVLILRILIKTPVPFVSPKILMGIPVKVVSWTERT